MDFIALVKSGVDKEFRNLFHEKHRDIYRFLSTHENLNKFCENLAVEIYTAERQSPGLFASGGLKKFDDIIASYARVFAKGALGRKENEIRKVKPEKTWEERAKDLEDELIGEGYIKEIDKSFTLGEG